MRIVIETQEHKVISAGVFQNSGEAEDEFEAIVREFGFEPNDSLYEEDGTAFFDDGGDYTVQLIAPSSVTLHM